MVRRKRDSVLERKRGRGWAKKEKDGPRLNPSQVVPLTPAKAESDYEVKRSFILIASL